MPHRFKFLSPEDIDKSSSIVAEVTSEKVAIGYPDARAAFRPEQISGTPYPPPGGDVNTEMVLPQLHPVRFQKTLLPDEDTVGYPMQILLIYRGGEQTLHQSSLHEGSTGFKRYTAGPGEARATVPSNPSNNLVMNDDS